MTHATAHVPRVLLVGNDATLAWTRQQLLSNAGYETVSLSLREVSLTGATPLPPVVLICRSVKEHEAKALSASLRQLDPGILAVRNGKSGETVGAGYDRVLPSILTPIQLLNVVADALARDVARDSGDRK